MPIITPINEFNENFTHLLKDVRKVNNIWRYLRQGWFAGYHQVFMRQFYLTYDYRSIGFDSEEEFAYRLAALLEAKEPEYLGRISTLDIVKNPFISDMKNIEHYSVESGRAEAFGKHNAIGENYASSNLAHLNLGQSSNVNNGIESGEDSKDNKNQVLAEGESIGDTSRTQTHLNRFSDSPQSKDGVLDQAMPIGATGTAGAVGTKSKHDHYPKAEALVFLPWNDGYLTNTQLDNDVFDEHTTAGNRSNATTNGRENNAFVKGNKDVSLGYDSQQGSQQGNNRGQHQEYSDTQSVDSRLSDKHSQENLVGLSGFTVGQVWKDWQESQDLKNVVSDYVEECKIMFLRLL